MPNPSPDAQTFRDVLNQMADAGQTAQAAALAAAFTPYIAKIDLLQTGVGRAAVLAGLLPAVMSQPNVHAALQDFRAWMREAQVPVPSAPPEAPGPTHRWTIEALDGGRVRVCRGEHQRAQDCEWETYVLEAPVLRAREKDQTEIARLNAVVANLRNKLADAEDARDAKPHEHGLQGVDAQAFADGCATEQRKLYGHAPHADALKKAGDTLAAAVEYVRDGIAECEKGDMPRDLLPGLKAALEHFELLLARGPVQIAIQRWRWTTPCCAFCSWKGQPTGDREAALAASREHALTCAKVIEAVRAPATPAAKGLVRPVELSGRHPEEEDPGTTVSRDLRRSDDEIRGMLRVRDGVRTVEAVRVLYELAQRQTGLHLLTGPPNDGVGEIALERDHQRAKHSEAHDDTHDKGEMLIHAWVLLTAVVGATIGIDPEFYLQHDRWGLAEKHAPVRKRLQIAGALVAAELDRRKRAAINRVAKKGKPMPPPDSPS